VIQQLLILGLASATISTTLGSSKLFKPFRLWVTGRSDFLGELISCAYCLGHYSAAALTLWYLGFDIVGWLAVTAISALASGVIGRLYGD
jgi:hypothetical protein